MLWGEKVHHSVRGGLEKKRMHTKRASAQSINNCEHGLKPTLCLEGCGLRWEIDLSAWQAANLLQGGGLRWWLVLSAWQAANYLQRGGLLWWLHL
jgi:hypothetical protein